MTEIKPDGYGASLRRRREELGLSLDDVAASTRIRKTYLQALEEERLEVLPGGAYAVGFLRIYTRQLGLPVEPLLAALGEDDLLDEAQGAGSGDSRRRLKKVKPSRRRNWRTLLIAALLSMAVAIYMAVKLLAPAGDAPTPSTPPTAHGDAAPQEATPAVPVPGTLPAPQPQGAPSAPPVQAEAQVVEFAVIPPQGAVVRMLPVGPGSMKVSLDNQEPREYQLQPEQALNWKVARHLAVELSAPGSVRIWVDQQELAVAGHAVFALSRTPGQVGRPQ